MAESAGEGFCSRPFLSISSDRFRRSVTLPCGQQRALASVSLSLSQVGTRLARNFIARPDDLVLWKDELFFSLTTLMHDRTFRALKAGARSQNGGAVRATCPTTLIGSMEECDETTEV